MTTVGMKYFDQVTGRSASLPNEQQPPAETTEKTNSVAINFVKTLPQGPTQNLLSFLSKKDMDQLGSVDESMMTFLHGDGLSAAAFLDQLELHQQQGIPLTYAEHKRCRELVQKERNEQYCLFGRKAQHSASEQRLASIIRHLDCSGGGIGDYELREIVEAYPNLESLNLTNHGYIKRITDRGLGFIGKLSRLKALNLMYQSGFTDVGFAQISRLPLKSLSLQGCSVRDSNLISLANLSNTLTYLDLGLNEAITDQGLSAIFGPSLTSLHLGGCQVSDTLAALLATLPLKELSLNSSSITRRGLAWLQNLSGLTHLNLGFCRNLNDADLTSFFNGATCPLEYLNLADGHVAGSMRALERFPKLTHLRLFKVDLTDDQVALLGKLPLLAHLDLGYNDLITPRGIQSLRHLPLQSLDLGSSYGVLNDRGMQSLAPFTKLENLFLDYSYEITGDGLATLAHLPLKSLHLQNCGLNNQDLQTMSEALSVKFLDLRGRQCLTDPSARGAQALTLLPLEHLILGPDTFSEEGLALLKKTIPYVEATKYVLLERPIADPFARPFPINHS
jgi:hypothetical protein